MYRNFNIFSQAMNNESFFIEKEIILIFPLKRGDKGGGSGLNSFKNY